MDDMEDESSLGIYNDDEFIEDQDDDSFYMSESYLKQIAGCEDLNALTYIELTVDSTQTTLGLLGERMPDLQQLKLNNSILPRIRDLGTCLKNLQVLWLARSGLEDLGGIAALPMLRELYASFNDVSDVNPLGELEDLQVLDLEANQVEDMDSIGYLAMCPKLSSLTLENNPLFAQPAYRRKVVAQLPQLQMLDDMPISEADRLSPSAHIPEGEGEADDPFAGLEDLMGDPEIRAELEKSQREVAMVADGIKYAKPDVDDDVFLEMAMAEMGHRGRGEEGMVSLLAPHVGGVSSSGGSPVRPGTPSVLGNLSRPSTGLSGGGRPPSSANSRASSSGSGGGGGGASRFVGGMGIGLEQLDRPPVRPGSASIFGRSSSFGAWGGGAAGGGGGAGGGRRRPSTARPGSAARRAGSAGIMRPGTARPGTASILGRASSAKEAHGGGGSGGKDPSGAGQGLYWRKNRLGSQFGEGGATGQDDEEGISSLTHGSEEALIGNPTKALRARRKDGEAGLSATTFETGGAGSATAIASELESLDDHRSLLEELKRWKMENAHTLLARWDEERGGGGGALHDPGSEEGGEEPWEGARDSSPWPSDEPAEVLVVDCAKLGDGAVQGGQETLAVAPSRPRAPTRPESPRVRRTASGRSTSPGDEDAAEEAPPRPPPSAGLYESGGVTVGRLRPKNTHAVYQQRVVGGPDGGGKGAVAAVRGGGGEESPDSPLLLQQPRDRPIAT